MKNIRVAIIEDQEEIRKGYEFLINSAEGFECIGFETAEAAIESIGKVPVDVVLMDVKLPGMDGITATRFLKEKMPGLLIMMFTIYENNENVFEALAAGASGYLLKQATSDQLLEAIRDLYHGGAPMSSHIARKVVSSFRQKDDKEGTETLSAREKEVLTLISAGYRNKDVAEKLFISISTVKSHIYSIYQKLHVNSRIEAVNKMRNWE